MVRVISDRGTPGYAVSDGGILLPEEPLKQLERQRQANGARIDLGDHYQHRYSITAGEGSTAAEQFSDCLKQFRTMVGREKLSLNHAVQLTVFVPSEGFEEAARQFKSQMEQLYGGPENTPPVSFVGQTPAFGRKAGLEAVVLAPKKGHDMRLNQRILEADNPQTVGPPRTIAEREVETLLGLPEGSLEGAGGARYSVAEIGGRKWVYSAGLTGNPESASTSVKARGALAKEMAILLKEGVFDRGALSQYGLINSHHYVHEIVGPNYNDLNVERDGFYTMLGLHKYPSATGIGMFSRPGDVVVEMVGAKGVEYEPVVVKQHGEAYQYALSWLQQQAAGKSVGGGVGGGTAGQKVSTPKFSRALYLPGEQLMLVSGTASVESGRGILYGPGKFDEENREDGGRGVRVDVTEIAESAGLENLMRRGLNILAGADNKLYLRVDTAVEAQTLVTARNITRLLKSRDMRLEDMAQTRVYVKHLEDDERVMGLCGKIFGRIPSVCVQGPVCYDDMLMEIEGVASGRRFNVL